MNLKRLTVAVLALINVQYANAATWVPNWVDGAAPANFESGPGYNRTYVNLPQYGGHATYTLQSQAPTSGAGTHFGAASTATTPKIATTVKIPIAGIATAATATLTAVISKNALAKAAMALVRLNPYVSAAMTFGWLGYAGYQYFADTDSFASVLPSSKAPSTYYKGWHLTQSVWIAQQVLTPAEACLISLHSNQPSNNNITANTPYPTGIDTIGYCSVANYSYKVTGVNMCSSNYTYSPGSGQCVLNANAPVTPVPDSTVETALTNSPISSGGDTAQKFDGVLKETISNGVNPHSDGTTPTLTGSITPIQGPKTVTTTPDGTVSTSDTQYTPSYNGNHVDIVETKTITNIDNQSNTTTTTATGTPPPDQTTPSETLTDCDKYPNSIGCAQFGTAPTPETIPTTNVPLSLSPTSLGAGTCPAPTVMHLSRGDFTMSNQPLCDFATGTAPVAIALAWLAAGMIVFSPIKG